MRLIFVFCFGLLFSFCLEAKEGSEDAARFHFSLAQSYASDGQMERAIEEYKLTLTHDPHSALVYTRLAAEYIKKGIFSSAVEACESALKEDPDYSDARLILAGIYANRKHFQEAIAQYDHILKKDPHHEEATIYKSEMFLQQEKPQKAVLLLHSFLKKHASFLAYYYLGRAEQQQGHFQKAVSAFKHSLEEKPGFQQAMMALGYLYQENQKIDQALSLYEHSFQESSDPLVAAQLSALYLHLKKYQEAIPYLEFLRRNDPEDLNLSIQLAILYMDLKDYEKSVGILKSILEKKPESDQAHYYLGYSFEQLGKVPQAILELKAIHSDSSLYEDATLHLVYLLKSNHQWDAAQEWIKQAISSTPDLASFYLLESNLEKDRKKAIQILESVEKKFSENEAIHYYLGSLYDQEGDGERAVHQMETVIKLNPQHAEALNYLGYTWTQQGIRLNDAERFLKEALRLRPDSGYIQDSWGWYLFVKGRVKEAIVQLEKAAKWNPKESSILEHLGDAYLRYNLREEALTRYSDALKYSPDETFKKRMSQKKENLIKQIDKLRSGK